MTLAGWRSRLGTVSALVALTLGGASACAQPAVEVTPADGANLPSAPTSVSLALPDRRSPQTVHLSVVADDGADVTDGPLTVRDGLVSVDVAISRPGRYLVGYHLVLADGQESSGVTAFQVGPASALPSDGPADVDPLAGHDHGAQSPFDVALVILGSTLAIALVVRLLWPARPRRRGLRSPPRP